MISKKSQAVMAYFDSILPEAACELNYTRDYELLIAVMLSAQTTDKAVNRVTAVLFDRFPTLEALDGASTEQIEECIRSLGLYKNKAQHVKGIARELLKRFQGRVPSEREALTTLPGVGRKTANVVRCEIFHEAEFPVDTHIDRISKRLAYAQPEDSVLIVEQKLRRAFPRERYIRLHHQFIHFGRYYCSSQNPRCEGCLLQSYCLYFRSARKKERR